MGDGRYGTGNMQRQSPNPRVVVTQDMNPPFGFGGRHLMDEIVGEEDPTDNTGYGDS